MSTPEKSNVKDLLPMIVQGIAYPKGIPDEHGNVDLRVEFETPDQMQDHSYSGRQSNYNKNSVRLTESEMQLAKQIEGGIVGAPMHREHVGTKVGTIISSYINEKGQLHITGYVTDMLTKQMVISGKLRGLSIRFKRTYDWSQGKKTGLCYQEVSLVEKPFIPECEFTFIASDNSENVQRALGTKSTNTQTKPRQYINRLPNPATETPHPNSLMSDQAAEAPAVPPPQQQQEQPQEQTEQVEIEEPQEYQQEEQYEEGTDYAGEQAEATEEYQQDEQMQEDVPQDQEQDQEQQPESDMKLYMKELSKLNQKEMLEKLAAYKLKEDHDNTLFRSRQTQKADDTWKTLQNFKHKDERTAQLQESLFRELMTDQSGAMLGKLFQRVTQHNNSLEQENARLRQEADRSRSAPKVGQPRLHSATTEAPKKPMQQRQDTGAVQEPVEKRPRTTAPQQNWNPTSNNPQLGAFNGILQKRIQPPAQQQTQRQPQQQQAPRQPQQQQTPRQPQQQQRQPQQQQTQRQPVQKQRPLPNAPINNLGKQSAPAVIDVACSNYVSRYISNPQDNWVVRMMATQKFDNSLSRNALLADKIQK